MSATDRAGTSPIYRAEDSKLSETIVQTMTEDHRRCDRLLARVESAAEGGSRDEVATSAREFIAAMEQHFQLEESSLFPALESAAPFSAGPAGVMRMEHRQMRQLLEELEAAVAAGDVQECLGVLETLHLAAQQHNAKEEAILYPMADQLLDPSVAQGLGRPET